MIFAKTIVWKKSSYK